MESAKRITGIFFAGIAVSSFIISPDVLDMTLVVRLISLSLFLLATGIAIYRSGITAGMKADLPLSAYALYVLFCCASVCWANTTSEALFESARIVAGFFVFLLTVFAIRHEEASFTTRLLKLSVVLCFLEIIVSGVQRMNFPDLKQTSLYGITGLNGHKNLLSSFLLLNLFFLIKAAGRLKKYWKIAAILALLLNLLLLLVLRTKAVWLGLLVAALVFALGCLLLFVLRPVRWKAGFYILTGTILLLANVFFLKALPLLIEKGLAYNQEVKVPGINTSGQELDDERLTLWQKTYTIFHKKPLLGTGAGNWQIFYPDAGLDHLWRAEELNYTFQRPHNDWLWVLSETGLIGFNLLLLFLVSILVLLFQAARSASEAIAKRKLIGYAAILTGYFTAAFFDFPRERIEHVLWLHLILGMAYSEIRNQISLPYAFTIPLRRLHILTASVILAFIAYIGILRHQGEFSLRKMYGYKNRVQLSQVIDLCRSAGSFAYSVDPTSVPIYWYSGNAKAQIKDYEGAHLDFLEAYRINPYNRNVLNDLGSSFVFRNEPEQAKLYYREAARISPRFDDPKLNLAALYIREGNYKMALLWLKSLHHPSEKRSAYEAMVKANLN